MRGPGLRSSGVGAFPLLGEQRLVGEGLVWARNGREALAWPEAAREWQAGEIAGSPAWNLDHSKCKGRPFVTSTGQTGEAELPAPGLRFKKIKKKVMFARWQKFSTIVLS